MAETQPQTPKRPRLKQGETPQSASFQKRMREFNRQVALAEANEAKAKQDARDAEKRASRDVLSEVSTAVKEADEDAKVRVPNTSNPNSPAAIARRKKARVAESGRAGLEGRQAKLDAAEKESGSK